MRDNLNSDTIKLQKAIAMLTGMSRRQAEKLIVAGKVKVDGKQAEVGQRVKLNKAKIEVEGKLLNKPQELIYLVIYKSRGVITSRSDELGRKTIMNLVPKKYQGLFPVGRLDYESEGLVLLTNDGQLAYELTHPKFEVEKTYLVKPDRVISHAAFSHLKRGMFIGKHRVIPKTLKRLVDGWIKITITSGQKHVVRKLFKHAGYEVEVLKRIKMGKFELGDLKPGDFKQVFK